MARGLGRTQPSSGRGGRGSFTNSQPRFGPRMPRTPRTPRGLVDQPTAGSTSARIPAMGRTQPKVSGPRNSGSFASSQPSFGPRRDQDND